MAADPETDQVAATADKAEEPLHNKKLQKLQKQYERRGIVYVSRIPPHMVRTSLESCSCVFALISRGQTLSFNHLRRNHRSYGTCWNSMVPLADCTAHLKVKFCSYYTSQARQLHARVVTDTEQQIRLCQTLNEDALLCLITALCCRPCFTQTA